MQRIVLALVGVGVLAGVLLSLDNQTARLRRSKGSNFLKDIGTGI
jgi:hypothetical protein